MNQVNFLLKGLCQIHADGIPLCCLLKTELDVFRGQTFSQYMFTEVIILPHDPAWMELFRSESRRILQALGDNALTAHHIGSTAIPGIYAKPVIDLLVVVADIHQVDPCNGAMENLGYEPKGEFGIPTRRYFRKDNAHGRRTHHVHIFAQGNPQIDRHLSFPDFLLAHPEWATRYSNLKRDLATRFPQSMDHYIAGKNDLIQQVD